MLNENVAAGKWQQVKGQIQKSWEKLTDDELEKTKGDMKEITGLIQRKYGEAQDAVTEKLNTFLKS